MTPLLIKAIVFITAALVFYTIGVWSEKLQGKLKAWHLILFYLGLVCDTLGTGYMSQIAGGFDLSLHSITGALAIGLMLVHAIWATVVLIRQDTQKMAKFHRFSIIVWAIWLIPYFVGMLIGIGGA